MYEVTQEQSKQDTGIITTQIIFKQVLNLYTTPDVSSYEEKE